METLHMIEARYLGPTNTRGSRFKLYSHRIEKGRIFPMRDNLNGLAENAERKLAELGYTVVGMGESARGYIYAVKEFCSEPFLPLDAPEHVHDFGEAGTFDCGRQRRAKAA